MQEKVLIVSNVTNGLISFRTELIRELVKRYEVIVLAQDNGGGPRLEEMGCRVIPMEFSRHGTNPVKEMGLIAWFKKKIQEIGPKVVLTYTIKPNIYAGAACARLRIPYIANITGLGPAVENGGVLRAVTIPLYRYGLRKARKVFFQNASNRDFMVQQKIVTGPWDLLPGSGVNLEKYQPQPWPEGDTVDFVFISRIVQQKGIDQYLEAAKAIRERHPETRFHICGGCEQQHYKEQLERLTEEGVVIYHGRTKDIAGMHRQCQCTVHPSFYPEGMSNVLLEASACARPVITTDRPGCRETVEEGVNGFLVRQRDSADLIEKLERFLALSPEQRKAMGLAGRRKVEREFDRNIVVRKYLEEIEK